jgi:hypothetical protein
MPKIPISDIDDVLFNPKRYLNHPSEVLSIIELDDDQKIALLLNWEYDLKQEAVAEEENMTGISDIADHLQAIKATLMKLGVISDLSHTATTKSGGI